MELLLFNSAEIPEISLTALDCIPFMVIFQLTFSEKTAVNQTLSSAKFTLLALASKAVSTLKSEEAMVSSGPTTSTSSRLQENKMVIKLKSKKNFRLAII